MQLCVDDHTESIGKVEGLFCPLEVLRASRLLALRELFALTSQRKNKRVKNIAHTKTRQRTTGCKNRNRCHARSFHPCTHLSNWSSDATAAACGCSMQIKNRTMSTQHNIGQRQRYQNVLFLKEALLKPSKRAPRRRHLKSVQSTAYNRGLAHLFI